MITSTRCLPTSDREDPTSEMSGIPYRNANGVPWYDKFLLKSGVEYRVSNGKTWIVLQDANSGLWHVGPHRHQSSESAAYRLTQFSAEPILPAASSYIPPFPKHDWISVSHPDAFSIDTYEIRLTVDRFLSADEISSAAGCLGYALRQELAGEELSDPYVIQSRRAGQTILLFSYDGTKSRRDDPDFGAAFDLAERYIVEGSPVRTSNRAGVGTKGTRLVNGIGSCDIQFAVR